MNVNSETLTLERRGHLLLIGLNRAAKRNAFNMEMLYALSQAYDLLEKEDELRVGVVFAHGDHFTAGLDLADVAPAMAEGNWYRPEGGADWLSLEERGITKPIVCAVQGYCFTIGLELLLNTDIRVAADSTRFAMLEVKRGIYPVGGATLRLPREVGWGNAMKILLTGDEFNAEEAYRLGLVQEVVPHGTQLERAVEIADRVAAQAPLGVRAALKNARVSVLEGEEAAAKLLLPDLQPILKSDDAKEGMLSFIERRTAQFKGK